MSPQPVAQSQARGGSADELQEVQITPQYILDEVEVTARRLDDNPTDSIRAGWSTSPDELRTIQADAAARPEGVVVSARKWNETDDRNLMHLTTPLWRGGGGMVDDYGDEIARRAIQMTDIGFDPVRQREDLALINELFTPWGQARTAFVGTYNFGVKLGGGFRSIPALFTGGVDAAVDVQQEFRAAAGVHLDSPFARAIAPQIEQMNPYARLGLEVLGDTAIMVPGIAGLRGMTAEISLLNRPLQIEFASSTGGPRLANQVGAVGDLSLLRASQLRNSPGVVTASGDFTTASGNWLDPSVPTPIPAQVARTLVGREFGNFAELREAIWKGIATDPQLNKTFSAANLGNIEAGSAPFAPRRFQVNGSDAGARFNLHHVVPIEAGGPVYDLSNLQIVSPRVHAGIHY